jgi:DNA repair exonuclease SbcCD ATPase subunit
MNTQIPSVEQFQALRNRIQDLENQKSRLKGQEEANLAQLKTLGFDSIEAAEAGLQELNAQLDEMGQSLAREYAELEKQVTEYEARARA